MDKAIRYFEAESQQKVISIRQLEEGTTNDIFLVNWDYIVRIRNKNETDSGYNLPFTEMAAISEAQKVKNAPLPAICHYDPNTGNKIEIAIKGAEPLRAHSEIITVGNLKLVIDALKRLHKAKAHFPFSPVERYYAYKKKSGAELPAGFEKKIIKEASWILENEPQVLCHNDLWAGNIILTGEGNLPCYLIDFEFAAGNAGIFDLASLIEENEIPRALYRQIIPYYFGENSQSHIKDVDTLMVFLDGLWYYWAVSRFNETNDPRFQEIAKTKKARFLRAFRKSLQRPSGKTSS